MVTIRKARGKDAQVMLDFCKQAGGEIDNLSYGCEGVFLSVDDFAQH